MSIEHVHFFFACHGESKHLRLGCLRRFFGRYIWSTHELEVERAMEMRG